MALRREFEFVRFAAVHTTGCYHDSKSESKTEETSNAKTASDQREDNVTAVEAGQAGVADFSNIIDSDVRFEVRNQGLSGDELSELLTPAGEALETISKGMNAQTSATGAFFATADSAVDDTRKAVESGWQNTKEVLTSPGAQLVAGGVVLYLLNRKKGKRAAAS